MKKRVQQYILSQGGSYGYSGKKRIMYVKEPDNWDDIVDFYLNVVSLFPHTEFDIQSM